VLSCGPLLCSSPPNTAPNEGIGIKDRGLVWTMLGLQNRGEGAGREQRVLVLLLQHCVCGRAADGWGQCVNVCSSFLEGNKELGVENALFNVGLSAFCNLFGEAMCVVSLGSCRGLCNAVTATGYGTCSLAPEKLFTDCTVGVSMYMVVYRSRCPDAAQY
jgi:hypothetical protein